MKENLFKIEKYGDKYFIVICNKDGIVDAYTSVYDISKCISVEESVVLDKMEAYNAIINSIEKVIFKALGDDNDTGKIYTVKMIGFEDYSDALNALDYLYREYSISEVEKRIFTLKEKYCPKKNIDRKYIEDLYSNKYVNDIWEIEKCDTERGNGYKSFESFLVNYIEQLLIYEE